MKNASINSAQTECGERKLLIFGACFWGNFRLREKARMRVCELAKCSIHYA
jgi:hypothetical protein